MTFLAILATIGATLWTAFVIIANGMTDSVTAGFQGAGTIWLAWAIAAAFWLAWTIG